jgi:serine/threonine-protein kinase RsbW
MECQLVATDCFSSRNSEGEYMIAVGDKPMFNQNGSSNTRRGLHSVRRVAQQIPSKFEAAGELIDSLLEWLDHQDWSDDETFQIRLCVEEALVNAIKHGNRHDSRKSVHVTIAVTTDLFEIQIADEGEGFIPSDVPDPRDESRLDLPSGRGLLLMHTYMTSVSYNAAGNEVAMRFDRSTPNGSKKRSSK